MQPRLHHMNPNKDFHLDNGRHALEGEGEVEAMQHRLHNEISRKKNTLTLADMHLRAEGKWKFTSGKDVHLDNGRHALEG